MTDLPRISSQIDHDNKWSKFERESHLPFGYFDADRHGHTAVALVCALAVVLLIIGVIS